MVLKNKYILMKLLMITTIFLVSFQTEQIFFANIVVNSVYIQGKIVLLLGIIICLNKLFDVIEGIKQHSQIYVLGLCIFVGLLFVYGLIFFLNYPGIWGWDEGEILAVAKNLNIDYWYGWLMPILEIAFLMIIPFPAGIVFAQIIFFCAVMSYIIAYFIVYYHDKISLKVLCIILGTLLLSPYTIYYILRPLRSTLFAILILYSVVNLIESVHDCSLQNNKINSIYFWFVQGLISICRSEGIIIAFTFVVLKFTLLKKTGGGYTKHCVINYILGILLILFVTRLNVRDNNYMIMSIINPMSNIITHKNFVIEDNMPELKKLDKVFDVELIRTLNPTYDNPSIPWSVDGAIRESFTDEDYSEMLSAYCKLIIKNFDIFFRVRMKTFLATTTLDPNSRGISYRLENTYYDSEWANVLLWGIFENCEGMAPLFPKVRDLTGHVLFCENAEGEKNFVWHICWNLLPMIFISYFTFILSLIKKKREMLIVSIPSCILIPVVFLLCPESNPMYYTLIYWLGFIQLIFSVGLFEGGEFCA